MSSIRSSPEAGVYCIYTTQLGSVCFNAARGCKGDVQYFTDLSNTHPYLIHIMYLGVPPIQRFHYISMRTSIDFFLHRHELFLRTSSHLSGNSNNNISIYHLISPFVKFRVLRALEDEGGFVPIGCLAACIELYSTHSIFTNNKI